MKYENYINFNQNITELKSSNDSMKLIKHIIDNRNRKTDRDLINKSPELPNYHIKKADMNKIKKELEETKNLKQGGKGAKPFRFITTTLNVEPNKQNEKLIKEWAKEMYNLYSKYYNVEVCYLHNNETRPHLHIVVKNWDKEKGWGNFVNGKKIKLSGPEGKALLRKLWKEGEEINKKLAEKYKKEFKQEATTEKGRDRTIQRFRALDPKTSTPEDLEKLAKWFIDKGLLKEQDTKITPKLVDSILLKWGCNVEGKWMNYREQLQQGKLNKQLAEDYKKQAEEEKNRRKEAEEKKLTPAKEQLLTLTAQITGTNNIVEQRNRLLAMYKDYTDLIQKEETRRAREANNHNGPVRSR